MPIVADLNASAAIAAEGFASRIVAPVLHAAPNAGEPRFATSMLGLHLARDFASQASARLRRAAKQAFGSNSSFVAAGAATTPKPGTVDAPNVFKGNQLTKSAIREVRASRRNSSQVSHPIQGHVLQFTLSTGAINP